MSKEQRNVPKLRFPEFTDTWGRCKVSDASVIIAGGTPSTSVESYWIPKEIPWLSSGEVHKKYITFTDNMISVEGLNHSSARMVEPNSVLIALAGQGKTRGTVAINRIPLTTNQSIAAMTFNENMVPEFVLNNLDSRYDEIRKLSSGDGSRGGLNKQLVGDIIIPYTSKAEQRKIADLLTNIDTLITLQQRKLDQIKEYKKGMLQKMFPKEGESVPEVRFPGFTGKWELRKLGEITDSYSGGTPTAGKAEYYGGDIPFIRSAEINSDSTGLFLTEEGLKNSSAKMINKGDVLYALYGATSGETGIARLDGAINQAILDIKPHENYDAQFIMQWLRKSKERIIGTYLQGGQGNLSGTIVTSLMIDCPDYEEQHKIGNFLRNIDDTITLHQRKLEAMKEYKKGLLQQMFV